MLLQQLSRASRGTGGREEPSLCLTQGQFQLQCVKHLFRSMNRPPNSFMELKKTARFTYQKKIQESQLLQKMLATPPAQIGVDTARCVAQNNSPAFSNHCSPDVWIGSQKSPVAEKFWPWAHPGALGVVMLLTLSEILRETLQPEQARLSVSPKEAGNPIQSGKGGTVPGHLAQVALPKERPPTLGPNFRQNATRRISGEALCSVLPPTCFSCSASGGKELEKETQEVATPVWCPSEGASLEATVRPALGRRAGWATLSRPLSLGPTQLTGQNRRGKKHSCIHHLELYMKKNKGQINKKK